MMNNKDLQIYVIEFIMGKNMFLFKLIKNAQYLFLLQHTHVKFYSFLGILIYN